MLVISAIVKFIKETLMSLHDTDKNNPRRNKPSLNAPDLNKNPLAHGTTQAQNSIDTPQADGLKIKERQINVQKGGIDRVRYGFQENGGLGLASYDGSNQRLLIGPDSTGTDVIKISEEGYDAFDATDEHLLFSSNRNTFNIIEEGTFSLSGNSGTVSGSFNVNFASVTKNFTIYSGISAPVVLLYVMDESGELAPVGTGSIIYKSFSAALQQVATREINVSSTGINVYINVRGYLSSGTTSQPVSETYYYKVVQDSIVPN